MKRNYRLIIGTQAATLLAVAALGGCGGGGGSSSNSQNNTSSVSLVTYADPWTLAAPRWRDIQNNLYATSFRSGANAFDYSRASVTLTYARRPSVAYFTGHIRASGLKPNFAYQLKLTGKPISGSRGTGTTQSYITASSRQPGATRIVHTLPDANGNTSPVNGDDWTNQQLGYAGRWWDDTAPPGTNITDAYFQANYPQHTIYGYIFMGDFVTDEFGRADVNIASNRSYHITWQDGQSGSIRDTVAGTFNVQSTTPPYYGYGQALSNRSVKLWYEYENGRPNTVTLPAGTYHCRLLVTEEAFHGEGGTNAGVWQTVLATEMPGDSNPDNDIVFTIGA